MGFKGVFITRTCFRDAIDNLLSSFLDFVSAVKRVRDVSKNNIKCVFYCEIMFFFFFFFFFLFFFFSQIFYNSYCSNADEIFSFHN